MKINEELKSEVQKQSTFFVNNQQHKNDILSTLIWFILNHSYSKNIEML